MKKAFLTFLLLSACGAAGPEFEYPSTKVREIPNELSFCPSPDPVEQLPTLRTTKDIADYTQVLEASREKLQDKLMLCDSRRAELYKRLKSSQ